MWLKTIPLFIKVGELFVLSVFVIFILYSFFNMSKSAQGWRSHHVIEFTNENIQNYRDVFEVAQ